jgi:hypothetical protein
MSYYDVFPSRDEKKESLSDTVFAEKLMKGIYGPRSGDARIIIDAEDSSKGCGKTGLAIFLAKWLSLVFDYDFTEDDLTLSGQRYLQRVREHPGEEQPSVIVLDEIAGAGAGHAYREMSNQNVELGNWWQLMRKKRIVSLVTVPHWSKVSKSMRREAEFRLHCLKEPIGYFKAYEVGSTFGDGKIRTRKLDDERIAFPDMPSRDDPHYQVLDREKDELLKAATTDADALTADGGEPETPDPDEVRDEERKKIAQRLRDNGATLREAGEAVGRSHTWVRDHTDEPGS